MSIWDFGRKVRMCVAGLGPRGTSQMKTLLEMEDVEFVGVCDVIEERAVKAADIIAEKREGRRPQIFTDSHEMLEKVDAEAMLITTDWCSHIRIAIDAMKHGVRPAMEVGGATDVFECWEMVRTSEQTGVPCMLLENCCFGKKEMTLLNMIKKDLFGDVVYCAGGYEHDLRDEIGMGDETHHYRQRNFMHRNGELYPTHELGPIAQYLNINRGNRMVTLTAMSSRAAGQQAWMRANRGEEWKDVRFNEGDVVTTLIKCAGGEMISLTHNCSLPRPYSRGGVIQGTKGIWEEDNEGIYLDGISPVDPKYWTHKWEKDEKYIEEYMHPLWKAYENFGPRGGHDGMDYLALRSFVESVQKGCQPPIDVYDAAAWMSITCLSEQSIALGSTPVAIPDFTNGRWMEKHPMPKSCFSLDTVHEDMFE